MQYFFEAIIFFFLITVGAYLIEIVLTLKRTKRSRLSFVLLGLMAVSWLVIFWGSFVEPRMIVIDRTEIVLNSNPENGIRAAVITDPHLGPYKHAGWARRIVEVTLEQNPDVVFLVGDYVFDHSSQVDMLESFQELTEHSAVYAVTGNHDYTDRNIGYIIDRLEGWGIEVLENENRIISIDGQEFVLAGVSDVWNDGNISETLIGVEEDQEVILLAHNPDVILSKITTLADLVISGHTHAGQIRLPWLGSVSPLPTILGRGHDVGLFSFDDEQLFISAGLGETGPRARLFNPPEMSILQIKW